MTWHPNTGKPPPFETVNIRQYNGMQTNGIRTAGWSWKLNDPAKPSSKFDIREWQVAKG